MHNAQEIKIEVSEIFHQGAQSRGLWQGGPKMSYKAVCCYCVVSKINFIKQCRGSKVSILSKSEENEVKVMKKVRKNVKKT
jgi:hypothetical protein